METINNVAAGVSKVIWGEGATNTTTQGNETAGTEPISGQVGKGTADSPYDQGNSETATDANKKPIGLYNADNTGTSSTSTSTNPTSLTDRTSTTNTTSSTSNNMSSSGTEALTGSSGSTDTSGINKTPNNPINAAAGGEPKPLENTDKTGVTSKTGDPIKGSDITPSNASSNPGAPSGGETHQKQQGADRPNEAPPSGNQAENAMREPSISGEELIKRRDPNDHSGEPMRIHDGSEEKKEVPATQEERRESKVGNPGGQEHGADPKGTGEQYVKTSGLAADGGDFDATKPGAGREADRLLEEKGIKKTESGNSGAAATTTTTSTSSTDKHHGEKKEKVSTVDKIKEKLHIGHKDK